MVQTNDLYVGLRDHISAPASDSGAEIELLKVLFTPDEVALVTLLDSRGKTVSRLVEETGLAAGPMADQLETLAGKGLIIGAGQGEERLYYTISIMRMMDNRFLPGRDEPLEGDHDAAELFVRYYRERFGHFLFDRPSPLFRVYPIEDALPPDAAEQDRVSAFISNTDYWALSHCTCRVQNGLLGEGCSHPTDVCTFFGPYARYLVSRGKAQPITREEALAVQERARDEALVITANDSAEPVWICNCCDCCCILLWGIDDYGSDIAFPAAYRASVDPDACTMCGVCVEVCAFNAAAQDGSNAAEIDGGACAGCAVCVTQCPEDAISLVRRGQEEIHTPLAENPIRLPGIDL